MASSFNDVDNGGPSTPQRQSMAIHTIKKDQELNGAECIKAMHLFKCDIAAMDMYLAINDSAICTEVIHLEIEDFLDMYKFHILYYLSTVLVDSTLFSTSLYVLINLLSLLHCHL